MNVLWAIIAILLAFWLIGAIINVIGALIHVLLIVALVLVVIALFRRNPAR